MPGWFTAQPCVRPTTWNWRKTAARLHWVAAVAQVMKNALGLLGVSAPDQMSRPPTEDE